MAESSNFFNLFNDEPAIPDANELLSLKILKDANQEAFKDIAKNETKWLSIAYGLIKRDPYLQIQMQGRGIRQAMKLANLLKQASEKRHFEKRIDGIVDKMVDARFKTNSWKPLAPLGQTKINEFLQDGDGDIEMTIKPQGGNQVVFGSD